MHSGEGKIMSLVPATFCRLCWRKLVGTRDQISFIRGKDIKLGEGETYYAWLGLS